MRTDVHGTILERSIRSREREWFEAALEEDNKQRAGVEMSLENPIAHTPNTCHRYRQQFHKLTTIYAYGELGWKDLDVTQPRSERSFDVVCYLMHVMGPGYNSRSCKR
jgi:hypothetical protein